MCHGQPIQVIIVETYEAIVQLRRALQQSGCQSIPSMLSYTLIQVGWAPAACCKYNVCNWQAEGKQYD